MEAQRSRTRGTRTRNRISGLGKTTLGERVHVQTVGLNAETKMERHRAGGEIFLLTFLFIGLGWKTRYSCMLQVKISTGAEMENNVEFVRGHTSGSRRL